MFEAPLRRIGILRWWDSFWCGVNMSFHVWWLSTRKSKKWGWESARAITPDLCWEGMAQTSKEPFEINSGKQLQEDLGFKLPLVEGRWVVFDTNTTLGSRIQYEYYSRKLNFLNKMHLRKRQILAIYKDLWFQTKTNVEVFVSRLREEPFLDRQHITSSRCKMSCIQKLERKKRDFGINSCNIPFVSIFNINT